MSRDPDDQIAYPARPRLEMSPERLAAVAQLHGLEVGALETFGYLEVG